LLEENLWRAVRHGLDGRMIDFDARAEYPAAATLDRLLAWTEPVRAEHGLEVVLPERNGAQRQRALIADGAGMREVFAETVRETHETYAANVTAS
jgi:carboxylate-amine ligase